MPSQEQLKAMAKPDFPGFIILGHEPQQNSYLGKVEGSFSMDVSKDFTQFHWTGTAYSILGKHQLDGRADAEEELRRLKKDRPDVEWTIYDVHADDLPVLIDWDGWRRANEPADTLSGVRNKYVARNPRFYMIEE
jgi:hypothetical protein